MSSPTRSNSNKTVVIAGSTGYLGRFLVSEYHERGWKVKALVRNKSKASGTFPEGVELIEAHVTKPETLKGIIDDRVDLVLSSVGITRQRDGLTYRDVDYQANKNLLEETIQAKVPQFAYIHVLQGESMAHLTAIQAKVDFVKDLEKAVQAGQLQHSTVIAPCGFFSDMKDFLDMAKSGRAYLFGDGRHTINPIHGADLAKATVDAIDAKRQRLDVGGPDVFTQTELAELAFTALQKPAKISYLWDSIRTGLIKLLPWCSPLTVWGPAQFFLTAMGQDMVGECHGQHHLRDHFAQVVKEEQEQQKKTSS
ncbi:Divinyl chlorophyllide a 8-vinyl-reductase, chloroplastic [Seminavis robusta]|uniref:Divinyl chlorophyllide a 8-vinyl-reductase, chloroplastic n=1 Tax=Seminavis robusta TaxID=568900 RepID=A0A9N8HKL3_9STRA|nr:Divinyl chlorophyllide a 8-vinyl-reductase, chloroplastic [Seminavis robusta]|eukprot:Sro952_g224100.1 Divinyl chlorophyllide a 8-vinyl-reductase, chloroplastic (309) ;mRNA; f:32100-33026